MSPPAVLWRSFPRRTASPVGGVFICVLDHAQTHRHAALWAGVFGCVCGVPYMSAIKSIDAETVAKWMLVGFKRGWTWREIANSVGIDPYVEAERMALCESAKFVPSNVFVYVKPVRAHIKEQWPKLYEFMLRNESNQIKLLGLVPQICKLRTKVVACEGMLSKDDKKEARINRKHISMKEAANAAARRQQLSTQRSAWNVCKK